MDCKDCENASTCPFAHEEGGSKLTAIIHALQEKYLAGEPLKVSGLAKTVLPLINLSTTAPLTERWLSLLQYGDAVLN